MSEIFVIGTIPCVGDYFARGGVDGAGFYSGLCRCKRGALGSMDDVEHLFHFVFRSFGGFAEYKGARDIGRIAFHRTATVDQHDRAFPTTLRLDRAMGETGKLADLYIGAALESQLADRPFPHGLYIPLRHA